MRLGRGVPIDLARFGLGPVARHAGKAVPLLAVDLGLCQRAGHRASIRVGRTAGDQRRRDQRLQLGGRDDGCFAHRPFLSTRATLSTVMKLTRWLASTVTPEM